ncbi:unnamed protein product [Pleuronectes platessa]|uniref:Uncharacterized protein n=1 Tax=Pleuronectes platessa TaxID=8262 RepID=A0A9N7TP95_PLEPL|nr:unnamed protein product [Pleuronectes platessa]
MRQQSETGPGCETGLHQTQTRRCSRKTGRNREALLDSVTVYHQQPQKRKKDLKRVVLRRWGWCGAEEGGQAATGNGNTCTERQARREGGREGQRKKSVRVQEGGKTS